MPTARWRSIDVLRGATVALMILVNNMGSGAHVFAGLAHAPWNGWTPTDLVFPTFLFVMGASMSLGSRPPTIAAAARRGLNLVGLGLALHALPHVNLPELRYPGVLQRLGITFFLAAVAIRFLDRDACSPWASRCS